MVAAPRAPLTLGAGLLKDGLERETRRSACLAPRAPAPAAKHPPMPLALTDDQLSAVWTACQPLAPDQRVGFLEALAAELRGLDDIGDGQLFRAIRAVQRKHFDPPQGVGYEPRGATYQRVRRAAAVSGGAED
jgi:hypothetical protein